MVLGCFTACCGRRPKSIRHVKPLTSSNTSVDGDTFYERLPPNIVEAYDLSSPNFKRRNLHLCVYCDVFFCHVQKKFNVSGEGPQYGNSCMTHVGLIDHNWKAEEPLYPHWETFELFVQSAESGCHICQMFYSQLRPGEKELAMKPGALKSSGAMCLHDFGPWRPTGPFYQLNLIFELGDVWYNQKHGIENLGSAPLRNRPANPWNLFSELHMEIGDSRSPKVTCPTDPEQNMMDSRKQLRQATLQARDWLSTCRLSHSSCTGSPDFTLQDMPKRLIHIGTKANGHRDLRLQTIEDLEEPVSYVAVSHTWGQAGSLDTVKLNPDNIEAMKSGISMESLPLTLQDAISVVIGMQDLGIHYLWIDALCIMQGESKEATSDWLSEGSRMDRICANAILTLAASTGRDDGYGLFPDYDPRWGHLCKVQGGPDSIIPYDFTLSNIDLLDSIRLPGLLGSRAWCVQEVALSQRICFFAPGRRAWKCRQMLADDRDPHRDYRQQIESWGFPYSAWVGLSDPETNAPVGQTPISIFWIWTCVRHHFTSARLTNRTDKLLAISGIARQTERDFRAAGAHERYVVGLWRGRLFHVELLWSPTGPQELYPTKYLAPSWSPLALDCAVGNITWSFESEYQHESLIGEDYETEVRFATDDQYGLLDYSLPHGEQAVLHISGPLFVGHLRNRLSGTPHKVDLEVGDFGDVAAMSAEQRLQLLPERRSTCFMDFPFPGHDQPQVYILLTTRERRADRTCFSRNEGTRYCGGLVLVRQEFPGLAPRAARYLRVGIVEDIPCAYVELARESWRLDDPSDYEERLPNGDYRITIV